MSNTEVKKFGFLVHPRGEHDILMQFPILRFLPQGIRRWIVKHLPPVYVAKISGLKDVNGQAIKGCIYAVPAYPEQMMEDRDYALQKIRQAVVKAKNDGVSLIGLGGLTASLSHGGKLLTDISDIGITTGRAYTVKNVTDYVKCFIERLELEPNKTTVAVVGAAGSIGSSSAIELGRWGIDNFILIDIEEKLESLKEALAELHDTAYVSHKISAIKDADIVITATNAPEVLVEPEDLKPGAVIINDAQPSDVSERVHTQRNDVIEIEAGVVNTPGVICEVDMGLVQEDDTYCCLAEVLTLAHHQRFENYAISYLDHDLIHEIEELAKDLDFLIATPQNRYGIVEDEQIQHVKSIIHSLPR